jgi:hypothetical protein
MEEDELEDLEFLKAQQKGDLMSKIQSHLAQHGSQ